MALRPDDPVNQIMREQAARQPSTSLNHDMVAASGRHCLHRGGKVQPALRIKRQFSKRNPSISKRGHPVGGCALAMEQRQRCLVACSDKG